MVIDKFWLDCMEKVNSRLKSDWDKEKEEFAKTFACGPIRYAPSRVHDQDEKGLIIMDDPHYFEDLIIPLKYSEPSEEYIHTIKFMEQIRKDLESMCYCGDRSDMIIVDDPHDNDGSDDKAKCLPGGESLDYPYTEVVAMGAGSGGWPTNSNDWAKVYQKAFPEAPEGTAQAPKVDPKDMSVKAETEEDRDRLWQAVMEAARGT